jgi:hypothetical protein
VEFILSPFKPFHALSIILEEKNVEKVDIVKSSHTADFYSSTSIAYTLECEEGVVVCGGVSTHPSVNVGIGWMLFSSLASRFPKKTMRIVKNVFLMVMGELKKRNPNTIVMTEVEKGNKKAEKVVEKLGMKKSEKETVRKENGKNKVFSLFFLEVKNVMG